MKTEITPVIIPGSVSVDNCRMLRAAVEGRALEEAGEPVHDVHAAGVEFYQLNSRHILATYLLVDGKSASWDADKFQWVPNMVPADHIKQSQLMERIY